MKIIEQNGWYDVTHNGVTEKYNYQWAFEQSLSELVNELIETIDSLDDMMKDESIGKMHNAWEYAWECYGDTMTALKHIHGVEVKNYLNYDYEYKDGEYIRHYHKDMVTTHEEMDAWIEKEADMLNIE